MMKSFAEALCSNEKNEKIPEAYDYFGGLIGEWDIEWNDRLDDTVPRRVKGVDILACLGGDSRSGFVYCTVAYGEV